MSDTTDEDVETLEQRRARRVEAFAARSGRHRRWAEAFIDDDDPIFAIACEVVDHEARLDALAETVERLAARDDGWRKVGRGARLTPSDESGGR